MESYKINQKSKNKLRYKSLSIYSIFKRLSIAAITLIIITLLVIDSTLLPFVVVMHLLFIFGVFLNIFLRYFVIGMLSTVEMDWHTLYEIDKRKDNKRNEVHNTYLLMNRSFWDGEFDIVIEYANKIICLSNKKETIFEARHLLILSEFFNNHYEVLNELIYLNHQEYSIFKKRLVNFLRWR